MVKVSSRQIGSVHVVIIVILVVALLGVLGYIFWNNFLVPKDTTHSQTDQTSQNTEKDTQEETDDYLVLEDWKVKFKLPETADEIHYYKKTAEPNQQGIEEYYEFSTKRVEDLGEQCVMPNEEGFVIRLGFLSRSKVKREEFVSSAPANNNEPIDGYYYVASGGNSMCAMSNVEMQELDRDMIYEMLLHPIAL